MVPAHLRDDPAGLHNGAMTIAWYTARATWRSCWRIALAVALIGGLLGSVALGALAGARLMAARIAPAATFRAE